MATKPKLTDALKGTRRKKAPKIAPVVVNNDAAAGIATAMQQGMDQVVGIVNTVMAENQRLLTLLTEQNEKREGQLTDIHQRQPIVPIVKFPPRPREFSVELEKDSDGNTTGMKIKAGRLN